MTYPEEVIVYAGNDSLVFSGAGTGSKEELLVSESGIEGWYGTPDLKTGFTERGTGDGAHDVQESAIIYASRVVSLHFVANAEDRAGLVRLFNRVGAVNHRMVRMRLRDGNGDTFVEGMCEVTVPGEYGRDGWLDDCLLTVTCPRPERLSWRVRSATLVPLLGNSGGLSYGDAGQGLVYPLDYGVGVPVQNQCVLTNAGSSPAFPVFTVQGPFSGPVRLVFSGSRSGEVGFEGNGERGAFVLDSRSRTMSMNGSDVSRRLSSRGFVSVPPGGSVTVTLLAAGDGWCRVEWRDTWM